jgi:hypothetical protein
MQTFRSPCGNIAYYKQCEDAIIDSEGVAYEASDWLVDNYSYIVKVRDVICCDCRKPAYTHEPLGVKRIQRDSPAMNELRIGLGSLLKYDDTKQLEADIEYIFIRSL